MKAFFSYMQIVSYSNLFQYKFILAYANTQNRKKKKIIKCIIKHMETYKLCDL